MNPAYERPRVELTASSQDPTRTKTLRRAYAQKLRGAFSRINSAIRERVVEDDILGYHDNGELFAVEGPPDLSTVPSDQAIERFEDWIDDAQDSEVMTVIDRNGNTYVERAYEKGITDADRELARSGVIDEAADAAAARQLMAMPVHERKLQRLFSKNFAELDGITDATSQRAVRELATGIGEGLNPTEVARNITNGIDAVGKNRATVLARTEIIEAHAESTLTRYEEMGVEEVEAVPEVAFSTAGDQRVCEKCAELAGTTYTIDDARGVIPAHPQCRCSWSVAQ